LLSSIVARVRWLRPCFGLKLRPREAPLALDERATANA
jgi:hypothetical protein